MLQKICDHFEELLGSVVLAVMATVTFVNVVTRYVIIYPLAFTEEVTVSLFVWLVLLGASMGFRNNAHLAMTFFYDLLPLPLKKACVYISIGLTITFFLLLTWLGTVQVMEEIELGVTTDSLAISAAWYSIGVPAFSVLIIARVIQASRKVLRERAL
jgi:TRAP-type C4-dicarboxylate transport system permease small subunit